MPPKAAPKGMPSDEVSLDLLRDAWSRVDPRNRGTIASSQMLDAVDAIEDCFGLIPGKFISPRGRDAIARFSVANPMKRINMEQMAALFDSLDGTKPFADWVSVNQDSWSDYDDGDQQSDQTANSREFNVSAGLSPPASPNGQNRPSDSYPKFGPGSAIRAAREQKQGKTETTETAHRPSSRGRVYPDILGDLPNVLPELDNPSPTKSYVGPLGSYSVGLHAGNPQHAEKENKKRQTLVDTLSPVMEIERGTFGASEDNVNDVGSKGTGNDKSSTPPRTKAATTTALNPGPRRTPTKPLISPIRTSPGMALFRSANGVSPSPSPIGSGPTSRERPSSQERRPTSRDGPASGRSSVRSSRSSPTKNKVSWARSMDESFFENMRRTVEGGKNPLADMDMGNLTDGDQDALIFANVKARAEMEKLREYADYCETKLEDSEVRHDTLEASIRAKSKECRDQASQTKAHQEGLKQVSFMISELTDSIVRRKRTRSGSNSSTSEPDILETFKERIEVQLAELGKTSDLQEAVIKQLTSEKGEQQTKVEALEAKIEGLKSDFSNISTQISNMSSKEKEDFLAFEAKLGSQQTNDKFSSIDEILAQQNAIIKDLKEKLLKRETEKQVNLAPLVVSEAKPAQPESSTFVIWLKNLGFVLLLTIFYHLISETFFPSNLPEGVVWWMNTAPPIHRVFSALDTWVARNDAYRMPM